MRDTKFGNTAAAATAGVTPPRSRLYHEHIAACSPSLGLLRAASGYAASAASAAGVVRTAV